MPIYEYQCQLCAHQVDKLQKMNDAPLTECPLCHEPSLQRLVSAAGFQLKGTGWYVTDFRDKPAPAKAASPDAAKVTEAAPSTTVSAAKPAE